MTPTGRRNPSATRTASTSQSTAPPSVRSIKVTGVIFGGLRPLAVDPVRDAPSGHCFNCRQYGHSRRACPRHSRRGYYINCGRRGDEIANYPRGGTRGTPLASRDSPYLRLDAPTRRKKKQPRLRRCHRPQSLQSQRPELLPTWRRSSETRTM